MSAAANIKQLPTLLTNGKAQSSPKQCHRANFLWINLYYKKTNSFWVLTNCGLCRRVYIFFFHEPVHRLKYYVAPTYIVIYRDSPFQPIHYTDEHLAVPRKTKLFCCWPQRNNYYQLFTCNHYNTIQTNNRSIYNNYVLDVCQSMNTTLYERVYIHLFYSTA